MKNSLVNQEHLIFFREGFEKLSISELNNIRGGNADERSTTKETDVYDKREV